MLCTAKWQWVHRGRSGTACHQRVGPTHLGLHVSKQCRPFASVTHSQAPSAAIWRIVDLFASPCFEVYGAQRVIVGNVFGVNSLDRFESPLVLANAADGDPVAIVKHAVFDGDVGRVGLGADAIIAVVNDPVRKGDVRAVDCVGPVGVCYGG
jgi:hypothetical protein